MRLSMNMPAVQIVRAPDGEWRGNTGTARCPATKFRPEPGVTELRIELKAAGYSPIPLVGKVPPSAGWPTMADSEDAIRMWPTKYPWATNTGIKTRNTPAIDVDIT